MNKTRNRFLGYAVVGVLFGVVNWFFLNYVFQLGFLILSTVGLGDPILTDPLLDKLTQWSFVIVWALQALVIILIEIWISRRPVLSALAVTLSWFVANVAYYVIYAGKLLLGFGGPQLGVRLDQGWATYWQGVSELRVHQMVGRDFLLWGTVAIVGGIIVGWLGGFVLLHILRWWQVLRLPVPKN